MSDATHDIALRGCTPVPLAHYLKALGVLRIVAEQADNAARGSWEDDVFHLRSTLDRDALTTFILDEYAPTPLVAPWNGGSGFYPKDSQVGIQAVETSPAPRLVHYADAILRCREAVSRRELDKAPKEDEKGTLLIACRNTLPDDVVAWLDAAYALTPDGPRYPPLLGTGGNDGRLDFTNNFMQRVVDVVDPQTGVPTSESASWLDAALFGAIAGGLLTKKAIGQFMPGGVGGANAAAGFDGDSITNPWDFILMLEGALVFSGSVTRRMQATGPGVLSYPFTVRSVDAGYGTASGGDLNSARAETWMPLWDRPATYPEIQTLMSEGRATVQQRRARDGVDFARAVAGLSIDRGISAFERFGYLQRNGQAYIAASLGRWQVPRTPSAHVSLLNDIDPWLNRVERVARGKDAPGSIKRAVGRVKDAAMEVCGHDVSPNWQRLLCALGSVEQALSRMPHTVQGSGGLTSLLTLSGGWARACDDRSPEFRLALSLASIRDETVGPLRANMVPLDMKASWPRFDAKKMDQPAVVWRASDLCDNMIAALQRRCMDAQRLGGDTLPLAATVPARLDDISRFIYGEVNDRHIEALVWGLVAVRIREQAPWDAAGVLPAGYCMLKLVHLPYPVDAGGESVAIPYVPAITRFAAAGRMAEATRAAARRLRGSGLPPALETVTEDAATARRIAAALLLPIAPEATARLCARVLKPSDVENLTT